MPRSRLISTEIINLQSFMFFESIDYGVSWINPPSTVNLGIWGGQVFGITLKKTCNGIEDIKLCLDRVDTFLITYGKWCTKTQWKRVPPFRCFSHLSPILHLLLVLHNLGDRKGKELSCINLINFSFWVA